MAKGKTMHTAQRGLWGDGVHVSGVKIEIDGGGYCDVEDEGHVKRLMACGFVEKKRRGQRAPAPAATAPAPAPVVEPAEAEEPATEEEAKPKRGRGRGRG